MNAQRSIFKSGPGSFSSAAARMLAGLMLAMCTLMFPAKDAQAMDVFEALDKVCGQLPELCGSYNSYKEVSNSCFKGSDELGCAVAILNVASGGQVSSAKAQLDAIVSCVKAGLPITGVCKTALEASGMPAGKINEAYGLVNQCAAIDDVDDAIVCADSLLDSTIADDADLGIPSWVNSLFDIYMDLRDKDYWGLVYDVGATVACAVANYFTSVDVCAFLEDIAEFAGDVADGAKAVGGALNNAGEDLFTNQTKHDPLPDFFNRYWLPEVDAYAQNIVVKQDTSYWNNKIGEQVKHCRNYFESHKMASDKSCRVCVDMRDGITGASECNKNPSFTEFPDKGFTQLASRRGAILLLPGAVKTAAAARIAQMRAQGGFKATPLSGPLKQYDPWKNPDEVPGVEAAIYRLYGLGVNGALEDPPLKRDAKTVNEAWRTKTVGYGAYMIAQAAKVAPATLNFPVSEGIAKKAIASGEAGIDFAAEVKAFVQDVQAARVKAAQSGGNISNSIAEQQSRPLKEILLLCAPKATAICQEEVRERYKVCDAQAKAFYEANQAVIGDFDNKRGQDAIKKWGEIRTTCEAGIKAYIDSLPNVAGDASGTQSCQQFLGRPEELLCPDAAGFLACRKQVDIGKLKTCRQPGVQQVYTKSTGPAPTGPGTINPTPGGIGSGVSALGAGAAIGKIGGSGMVNDAVATKSCQRFLGRADELLCPDDGGYSACKAQVDSGKLKTCRHSGTKETYPKSAAPVPVEATPMRTCKAFLGRADESLCPDATSFNACKALVDAGKMKTCRLEGTQQVYEKVAAPAAARPCKPFLGRADEMLCPDAATFAACKAQVDSGTMKTCRQEGVQQAYSKPATAATTSNVTGATPQTGISSGLSGALAGGKAPSGNVVKPGALGLAVPKVDEAALKTCKAFLGRKDEMLCSDAHSFGACKTAVDLGQMKTCRMTGSQDVYKKR